MEEGHGTPDDHHGTLLDSWRQPGLPLGVEERLDDGAGPTRHAHVEQQQRQPGAPPKGHSCHAAPAAEQQPQEANTHEQGHLGG